MKEETKDRLKLALFSLACAVALVIAFVNPFSLTGLVGTEPAPTPYNETADARLDLVGARARANAAGRLLLIEYGGNWCPYCRAHAGLMATREVQRVLATSYEVVWVDVGRFDKNLDLYEPIAGSLEAVPSTLIVDPRTGRLLNPENIRIPDGDEREDSPDALAEWLLHYASQYSRTPLAQRPIIPGALPF